MKKQIGQSSDILEEALHGPVEFEIARVLPLPRERLRRAASA
jgi:hypothetical protein